MTIVIKRFSDKRLKVIRTCNKNDTNVRVDGDEISIVSTIDEAKLENDTIEACNIWNLMYRFPDLKKEVYHVLECYFNRNSRY